MSGEFREVQGHYFHSVLSSAADAEAGQHAVSICLQDVYRALAPIERGAAYFEACDSDAAAPAVALVENWQALSIAMKRLDSLRAQYLALMAAAVRPPR